jgi:hypothetical protein
MLMHSFYCGLTVSSKSYLNSQSGKTFLELTSTNAHILLYHFLLENKNKNNFKKSGTPEESFDDYYELYNLYAVEKQVEEVKILSDKINEQSFANDPSFNVHQTSFGSYIANHVIKETIQRYNNEAMIPPKLGDVWIPKILIVVGKESHHAILDLGSSVNIISKELYDLLDLDKKWKSVTLIFILLMILPSMP